MFNLNQGFEEAAFKISAPADWVVDRAIDTIESAGDDDDRPLFLYLHFMDMHQPLDPPEPFASMFSTPDEKPSDDAPKVLGYLADRSSPEILGSAEFERFKSRVLARYDGSIRFADEEVGRLIDSMSEAGRWENTVFVFLSDHGEAFWDQPLLERRLDLPSFLADDVFGVGHGHTLFPDQVEVPLVMRGPGVPVARVKEQVRLIDVAPTLLSIVGVWHPDFEPRGERLVRAWQRGELTDRLALSETRTPWNRQRGIRGPEFALVRVDGDRELLFDHRAGALTEVTETRPGLLDRLREQLDARTPEPPADTEPPDGAGMWSTIDPRFCRELAELGYVLEGDCPTDRSGTDATDSAP
jgi:arylsulfatase A-like enzyme